MAEKRSSFTGKLGFVLATAGSAVGLGNIWRFPYLAAQHGGGIFLLVYLVLALTFGFALMCAEIAIGRKTGLSAIGAYKKLDKRFSFLGLLTSLVPIIILPYYSVIGGWIIKYLVQFVSGGMAQAATDGFFDNFISGPTEPIGWFLLYLGATTIVVLSGVEKGVEKVSKFMMPILVVLILAIALYTIFAMDGAVFPKVWLWSNFTDIFERAPMAQYMLNSIIIAGGSTAIAMICGIPAAYALARMKFKGQTAFLGFIIVSQMFAPVVLLIGIYKVMQLMGLTNSLLGLIFINAAFNQAFTIWLLRGTFMSISAEMEQAATIDGCNRVQAMMRVLLPVAAPGIVTTLIFIFINAWNEYTVALCLISTDTLKPLTVGINIFNGYNIIEWQYLFAASIFAIVPVVILFMSIEKNLTSGLTAGGVKG